MALVKVKTLGNAEIKEYSVDTIGQLKEELSLDGYSANVNGNAQGDNYELNDAELVTFAPSVKGGKK